MRDYQKIIVGVTLGLGVPIALFFGAPLGINWYAEHKANEFCDEISIGSDASSAVKKADDIGMANHYWFAENAGHSFIFHGLVMDYASCSILVDKNGKVTRKFAEMKYD